MIDLNKKYADATIGEVLFMELIMNAPLVIPSCGFNPGILPEEPKISDDLLYKRKRSLESVDSRFWNSLTSEEQGAITEYDKALEKWEKDREAEEIAHWPLFYAKKIMSVIMANKDNKEIKE